MFGHAILLALGILALAGPQAAAQGTIKGCVTDKGGGVIPGVEVVASSSGAREKVVTASSGCYELRSLPTGTYSVTAALAGFVTGQREGVKVVTGQTIDHVDFALCVGGLVEIHWIVPGGLNEAWRQADVVADVRIVATGPVHSECPRDDFEHTAAVIEIFKGGGNERIGPTLTFVQQNWVSERTPYRVGQEMIVFLTRTQQGFSRLAGPFYVFLVKGDEIVSFHSPVNTDGMTPADFMSKLRALAKGR
jgi:Carboxypeptidase regulatory-like domain